MTKELKNICWFGKDDKLVGFCDSGIVLATLDDDNAFFIDNENIWVGSYDKHYFYPTNIAEWS